MLLRYAGQTVLIGMALMACAARLHGHQSQTPGGVARELNRCLSIVNIAASRRRSAVKQHARLPRTAPANGRPKPSRRKR